jgi:hypothetical protein
LPPVGAATKNQAVTGYLKVTGTKNQQVRFNAVSLSRKSPLPGGRGQGRGETPLCNQPDFSPSPCPSLREGSLKGNGIEVTFIGGSLSYFN